jgi:hypothetical protein
MSVKSVFVHETRVLRIEANHENGTKAGADISATDRDREPVQPTERGPV